jgi:cyclophilin family peptidyl-prolyl cis-trans isomerase
VKVLLVNPSRFYSEPWISGELQHLFALHSYLRARCPDVEVDVIDLERELSAPINDLEIAEFLPLARAALATAGFDVVGISCWSSLHYLASIEVAHLCREINPGCTIVVGGYHPSAVPADFTFAGSPFDYVVVGEGERALGDIVSRGAPRTAATEIVQGTPVELADAPLLWDEYRYFRDSDHVGIWLTRGCPYACGYCLDRLTRWRGYSPARAVEELGRLHRMLPRVKQVNLLDPIFGLNPGWRRAFLEELAAARLDLEYWGETRVDVLDEEDVRRLAELRFQMDLGLDACTPRMIEIMMKARHPDRYLRSFIETDEAMTRHGVPHMIYLILNYPGETPESLQETTAFWTRYCHEHPGSAGALSAQSFKAFPGCEVYDRFADYEARYGARMLHPRWWAERRPNQMDLAGQVVPSTALAEAGQLSSWQTVKEAIEAASRQATGEVIRRELLGSTAGPRLLADARSLVATRRFALDPDTHLQIYPNRRSFLFNFTTGWVFLCSERETGWLEELLAGGPSRAEAHSEAQSEMPPPSGERERREAFCERLIGGRFLRVEVAPPPLLPSGRACRAIVHTALGRMEFALLPDEAPRTAASFVHLARSGYYDGLAIERSHPGAYLAAGAYLPGGEPPYVLRAEHGARPSRRGSLWMSIGRDGARFAICRAPWPGLDATGAVFGEMSSGWETLDRLGRGDLLLKVEIDDRDPHAASR